MFDKMVIIIMILVLVLARYKYGFHSRDTKNDSQIIEINVQSEKSELVYTEDNKIIIRNILPHFVNVLFHDEKSNYTSFHPKKDYYMVITDRNNEPLAELGFDGKWKIYSWSKINEMVNNPGKENGLLFLRMLLLNKDNIITTESPSRLIHN